MGKGCRSTRHQEFKDKAKNRVDDLQEIFSGLQSARKESRAADAAIFEEQVHQMLREWKAELNQPSPASSLNASSEPPSDILRMLQLSEVEDDATSKLVELFPNAAAEQQPAAVLVASNGVHHQQQQRQQQQQQQPGMENQGNSAPPIFHEDYYVNPELTVNDVLCAKQVHPSGSSHGVLNHLEGTNHLHYQQFASQQDLSHELYFDFDTYERNNTDVFSHMSDLLSTMCPPASSFSHPRCALWDCTRPAQGSDWCHDYCSSLHASLASQEGPPGMAPVLCSGGINLKDGPLLDALRAKTQGKIVGIPVCEGAATAKSPWNAPELFDLHLVEGETIREWLFFDKPRRAFESGNRKQRSLPDYNGRGWHESRKQVIKEIDGFKRSYYMDPQPLSNYEWHLFEYEISDSAAFALYRLEFKAVDEKKSSKSKLAANSRADAEQLLSEPNVDSPVENKRNSRGKTRATNNIMDQNACSAASQIPNVPTAYQSFNTVGNTATPNGSYGYGPAQQHQACIAERSDFYST